jgi:hypothetical protein
MEKLSFQQDNFLWFSDPDEPSEPKVVNTSFRQMPGSISLKDAHTVAKIGEGGQGKVCCIIIITISSLTLSRF